MDFESGERQLIRFSYVSISGQNLVPKPPLQVQEAVEKWRNSPRATCCCQRVSSVHVSVNDRLGLSTDSENEQHQLEFTSEHQPSQHDGAFIVFDKLLMVLHDELYHASAVPSGPAPSWLCNKRRDDILGLEKKNTGVKSGNTGEKLKYQHLTHLRLCAQNAANGWSKVPRPCRVSPR